MFAKLLKNEWRASRSVVSTLCVIILISGAMIGFGGLIAARGERIFLGREFFGVLLGTLMMLCVFAVAASCGASVFYALYRFYRSRFTEEGYLTYTLPVSNHSLMLSNILMSILEIALVLLAAAVAVGLAFGIFALALPWKEVGAETWDAIWRNLEDLCSELGNHSGEIASVLGFLILVCLSQLIVLMLSVTIGAIVAKKHPILMAVAAYYGLGLVRGAVNIFGILGSDRITNVLTAADISNLVTIVAGYFLMYWLTSKKLNLT